MSTSMMAAASYPADFQVLLALGFWGTLSTQEASVELQIDERIEVLYRDDIANPFPPGSVRLEIPLTLQVPREGLAWLIFKLRGQVLMKRPLLFPTIIAPASQMTKEVRESEALRLATLRRSVVNESLIGDPPELVYLAVCRDATTGEGKLRFDFEIAGVYSREYPITVPLFIAAGFRLVPGTHEMWVELKSAFTHSARMLGRVTARSDSNLELTEVHSRLAVPLEDAGIYYISVYVGTTRLGTSLFFAERAKARFSYTLLPADQKAVEDGHIHFLPKGARMATDEERQRATEAR
jgi:hypothetical protein